MYVRMITYYVRPGVDHHQTSAVYDELVEALQDQDGYQGCALLVKEDMSTAISLTYWSDEQLAGTAGKTILPVLYERTMDLSDRPPDVTGYHVLDYQVASDNVQGPASPSPAIIDR